MGVYSHGVISQSLTVVTCVHHTEAPRGCATGLSENRHRVARRSRNTDLRAFVAPRRGSSKWAQLLQAAVPIFKPRSKSFSQSRDLCSLSVWQVASAAHAGAAAGLEQSSTHTAKVYTSICSSFVVYVLHMLTCNARSRGFDGHDR